MPRSSILRMCVFAALTGRYERLNEQSVAAKSSVPFVCLTDDPDLSSDTWQIRLTSPLFSSDAVRSQRDLKIRPHVHLPDFDVSVYIDNSVLLSEPPELVFERYRPASGFCLPRHSFRDSLLDEFLEVARHGLDDRARVFEQLDYYASRYPGLLQERPYWGGILIRDHREPAVRAMLEIWAAHVHRYSRRDQLSLNAAFRQAGLMPDVMDIDNHASWFHSLPHTPERQRSENACSRTAPFSSTSTTERGQTEKALNEQSSYQEVLLALPSWRMAVLLSDWAGRHPRLARFVWHGLRPFF